MITIPPKVGIGRCVPKGFPYFYVEFGLDGGFAHVIEDEEKFPRTFARVRKKTSFVIFKLFLLTFILF